MKLLLHTCCAPCSVYCIDSLRAEGIEPTVYWFNPNIHPYMEYKARRDSLKEYTNSIGVEAIFEENYGLKEFCKNVVDDLENRCSKYCYKVRLEQTAKFAKENVYLINGNTNWSGINYNNYINRIVLFLEENYNIQTTYEKIEEFGNLYIYK